MIAPQPLCKPRHPACTTVQRDALRTCSLRMLTGSCARGRGTAQLCLIRSPWQPGSFAAGIHAGPQRSSRHLHAPATRQSFQATPPATLPATASTCLSLGQSCIALVTCWTSCRPSVKRRQVGSPSSRPQPPVPPAGSPLSCSSRPGSHCHAPAPPSGRTCNDKHAAVRKRRLPHQR